MICVLLVCFSHDVLKMGVSKIVFEPLHRLLSIAPIYLWKKRKNLLYVAHLLQLNTLAHFPSFSSTDSIALVIYDENQVELLRCSQRVKTVRNVKVTVWYRLYVFIVVLNYE